MNLLFGMIATLHTFVRDLKWNPHIHVLALELIYNPDKVSIKRFHHFYFKKVRTTFQYELLRQLKESIGSAFKSLQNKTYKELDNGFYVYVHTMQDNPEYDQNNNSKDINSCVRYSIRYVSSPAMAESIIIEYSRKEDSVLWFYHDYKDELKHIAKDNEIDFIHRLILYIPNHHFRIIHYYGFYSNASKTTLSRCHELLGDQKRRIMANK